MGRFGTAKGKGDSEADKGGDLWPDHVGQLQVILYQFVPLSEQLGGGDLPKYRVRRKASNLNIHDEFCLELPKIISLRGIVATGSVFDEKTGIGVCQVLGDNIDNTAYFTRRIADKFLVIGAYDREKTDQEPMPESLRDIAERFSSFKDAPNAADAVPALKGARLLE